LGVNSVMAIASRAKPKERVTIEAEEDCCETNTESEPAAKKCCKSKDKDGQELNTGLSQILLGVVNNDKEITRHQKRFGINSIIYKARRPFHPGRLYDSFLSEYFSFHGSRKEEEQETKTIGLDDKQQKLAAKGVERNKTMGGLMRSKGFVWIATSQYFMGTWQQAGNVLRIQPARPWLCELKHMWEGSPQEPEVLKEMTDNNGELYPYGDRCQEIVFIGKDLKHRIIQKLLDKCLLTDDEMALGERRWQMDWYDSCDKIRLPTKLFVDPQDDLDAVTKVNALEVEDMERMEMTEVTEEEENGHFAKVEVAPQVATQVFYDPFGPEE